MVFFQARIDNWREFLAESSVCPSDSFWAISYQRLYAIVEKFIHFSFKHRASRTFFYVIFMPKYQSVMIIYMHDLHMRKRNKFVTFDMQKARRFDHKEPIIMMKDRDRDIYKERKNERRNEETKDTWNSQSSHTIRKSLENMMWFVSFCERSRRKSKSWTERLLLISPLYGKSRT